MGDFYNGGWLGNSLSFVGSSWKFVPGYIKNVDTHYESFSSKKQVMKKLSPNSLWQTYMKWTVADASQCLDHCCMYICGSMFLIKIIIFNQYK